MHQIFVEKIYEEKAVNTKVSKDLSNTLNILSKTVFGDINRFIFELLQNADDAAEAGVSLHVKFRLLDNYLIFSHNGKHFTADDVDGISSVGSRASQKDKDSEKTGYKGVGFKSVFGSSDYAYICSGGFKFRFDRNFFKNPDEYPWQVIPIWTDAPAAEVEEWIDLKEVSIAIGIKDRGLILKEIKDVFADCQIILFLRNVVTITFFDNEQLDFTISRTIVRDHTMLYNNGVLESSWILKTMDLQITEGLSKQLSKLSETECPRKLMEAKTTKLIFAVKVENGRIIPLTQTVIYCYLPTRAQKGFPFLINGDFLTNAERTGLMPNIWNEFLFREIAIKQLEWFQELAETDYKYDILYLLKEKYPEFSESAIENAYNTGLDIAGTTISCLPVINDQKRYSTIAGSIIDIDHLTDFLKPVDVLAFMGLSDSWSILDLKLERQEVLCELGGKSFFFKDVFAMIASGRATDINSAIGFILFFYNNTANGDNIHWFIELQIEPFMMDEAGTYKRAGEIFLPAAQRLNYEGLGSISYIHPAILIHFKNVMPDFRIWLGKLGIKEPDNVEIFRKAVLPLIHGDGIHDKNFLDVTNFIFTTHKSKLLTEQDYDHIRNLPVHTNNGFQKPTNTYLSDEYNPDQKLSSVLSQANFLSKVYLGKGKDNVEWKSFFKRIGVRDKIRIDVLEAKTERTTFVREHPETETYFAWLDITQAYAAVYYRYRNSGQHHIGNFTHIEFRAHLAEPNFAKSFWNGILDDWEDFKNRCNNTIYYHIGGGEPVPSYVKYYVTNFPSVPANDGNCHIGTSLFSPALRPIIGEYLPTADFAATITKDQISFFGFKTELSFGECLEILDQLSGNELTAERKKQVFAIYDYMVGNSLYGRIEIKEWRKNARVLTINNTYQDIATLYIFNIYGNISPGNTERFLKIPAGKSPDEINALAKLLMVPIISIDMLELIKKGETVDASLKMIIIQKLVYLAIIHAHNTGDHIKLVLERLRTLVEARILYQAEELRLIYTSKDGEVIIDNEIDVWNSGTSAIYYSGDWKSPLVLYSLSSMLCDVLQLKDMEREFALILQLSDKEIRQWLIKNSYNVKLIEEFALFEVEYLEHGENSWHYGEISVDIQQETLKVEIFEEKVKVSDIDFSVVAPVQKAISDIQSSSVAVDYQIIENSKARTDIGRWSEEYIYEYFKSNPAVFTSVNWLNEESESNQPYDFEVVENGVERLIEVKGTPSLNKNLVYLSKKEWQVMIETGKAYSIFRVYGAGSESNYIHRIDDLKSLLNGGSIDFTVEMFL